MTAIRGAALAIWLIMVAGSPAFGQTRDAPSFEVGGGYAFLGGAELAEGYGAGWFADGGWRATRWLSLVGEAGRHHRRQDLGFIDVKTNVDSLVAGVRVLQRRPRFVPYVQVLVGAVRVKRTTHLAFPVDAMAGEDDIHGTLQIGGGLQIPLSTRLAVRVGADYRHVFDTVPLHHHRFVTGAVYAF